MSTATMDRTNTPSKPTRQRVDVVICALLVAVTLFVYWQALGFDFTNFDDNVYVTGNESIRQGVNAESVRWAFTTSRGDTWQPIVWLSYMADYGYAELDPQWYHFVNLLLHCTNAVLLYLLLIGLTGRRWPSAFVAAVFAVHPLHVEAVAWVAGRKDVLSTFFWLLAMLAYTRYAQAPAFRRYVLVALAFLLGLMSKPMLVSLPFVLILMDYWPLRRVRGLSGEPEEPDEAARGSVSKPLVGLLLEKAPLIAMSLAMIPVALVTQHSLNPTPGMSAQPLFVRAGNAVVAMVWYVVKTIWPSRLSVFYPYPVGGRPGLMVAGAALLVIGFTCLALLAWRRRPYVSFGWLMYLVTLLPVAGFVQFGKHAVADRFSYVPMIGLLVIVAWGIPDMLGSLLMSRAAARAATVGAAVLVIIPLLLTGREQASYWKNSATLFSHALQVTEKNAVAHYNLAIALKENGEDAEAMSHLLEVLKITPHDVNVNDTVGAELMEAGRAREAVTYFKRALHDSPNSFEALSNLGAAYAELGKRREAISCLRRAVKANPHDEAARENLRAAEELFGEH